MKSYKEYLNEAKISPTNNIEEFIKMVPKVFNLEEYLEVFFKYKARFGNQIPLADEIKNFTSKFDFKKVVLPLSRYIKEMKADSESGYYVPSTSPKVLKEKYDNLLINDPETLLIISINVLGAKKVIKNINKALASQLGKEKLAQITAARAYDRSNDGYDLDLKMHDYFRHTIDKIWIGPGNKGTNYDLASQRGGNEELRALLRKWDSLAYRR